MEQITFKLLVIGAGGTGGYFLKEFSRYLGNRELPNLLSYGVFDGDIVEEHNLERQSFQKEDIGLKKASVLVEALNDCLGTSWKCFPKYVTSVDELTQFFGELRSSSYSGVEVPVILGCVDNHGCRLICEEFFNSHDNCIYIDSANEIESGEVVFSYKIGGKQISPLRSQIFPDILRGDTRNVTEMSCEELNVHMPQHICTNMLAGNILLSSVCGLLESNDMRLGMTCFNARTMSMQFVDMTNLINEEKEA